MTVRVLSTKRSGPASTVGAQLGSAWLLMRTTASETMRSEVRSPLTSATADDYAIGERPAAIVASRLGDDHVVLSVVVDVGHRDVVRRPRHLTMTVPSAR